ncbi:MAG: class I SAM-dependent methyltransferase [Anaerolineales bacterium]|jgi:2-polyprenyl-3-methyl-5-hydroxy-6-metoxy-1,4-benzoquinol methylase|nr:class I SAM-dependent methyltransferase [Anaerolineales bacterium]|tara:strand:+ start:1099 stop:1635 length:537 start_codon:yes stop_codon:yes gene_type:complete
MSNTPHIHQSGSQPAQFLVDNITLLPKGWVFDVAMGNGRNAIYLASMGFNVEGVDISFEAVNNALELARKAGVTIRAETVDLETKYSIKKDSYNIIICFYYLQRSLITQIKDGLKVGGVVVYETYIVDQTKFGRPKNPDYLLEHNELLDMFRDFRCLRYHEGIVEDRMATASIVAEKI